MPSVFYQTTCGYGGIGRRSALRMLWRNPWGFKSPYPHQDFYFIGAFYACPENHNFANLCTKGMKNLRLLFGVCLGVLAVCGAHGIDYDDIARVASRATAPNVSTSTPARGTAGVTQSNKSTTTGRIGATTTSRERATTTVEPRTATTAKNISSRTATTTVAPRTSIQTRTGGTSIAPRTTTARTGTKSRTATPVRRTTAGRTTTNARTASRTISRAATNESPTLNTNYTRCRTIYYECMDEFCANKDSNLRRCACSSRANEFDTVKKNMSKFEDKMLDFNQRLLLVNLDAEDVDAINQSTEGEDAFYATTDKTRSKRALDEIANKLNATFGDDSTGTSLAPISLSLNLDSAFDTVDSFMGADTTTKSGAALYNAAIPICRETAMEVCTEDELSLAVGGYLMLMEQDCNTVHKAYQAQADAARAKVFESGALLDMSRLDAYQTRNADDILTCKRKMLEMLTNTTVCGTNMEKCLDMTGKYIDPTTGTAFLTTNLADLGSLITRPDANQSWTSANGAGKFITYLNNKKQFLAPAMENCQDIADTVWNAFIEDALAQIKLAQNAKLEEIRQACTTLTAECLTSAHDSIGEFDARALSVFGVAANRTVNAMCADVRGACTALMGVDGDTDWQSGVSAIATAQTYDSILTSCTQVGRNCIIQSCRSISGNFDLCDDIEFSPNRHAILERTACWPAVLNCVAAAGDDAILEIMASLGKSPTDNFYRDLYGNAEPVDDICASKYCTSNSADAECARCRIAERIWGNCEAAPTDTIADTTGVTHNQIHIPTDQSNATLLSWFATNTGTATNGRSCVNTRCTSNEFYPGYLGPDHQICVPDGDEAQSNITDDGLYCPAPHHQMTVASGITNCCFDGGDYWHHTFISPACCETGNVRDSICMPENETKYKKTVQRGDDGPIIVCIGDNEVTGSNTPLKVNCSGTFIQIDPNNKYTEYPKSGTGIGGTYYRPRMGYYTAPGTGQTVHQVPDTWNDGANNAWYIRYGDD